MISDLPIFKMYSAMAQHAAESQRVSATNISRAGEPGYKAVEVESFADFLSRTGHADRSQTGPLEFAKHISSTPVNPNGNSVSVENEVFNAAKAGGQHNMALSVYSKSIDLMRTAIGRRG